MPTGDFPPWNTPWNWWGQYSHPAYVAPQPSHEIEELRDRIALLEREMALVEKNVATLAGTILQLMDKAELDRMADK